MVKTVYVGGGYHAALTQSSSYQTSMAHVIRVASPKEWLTDWLEKHQCGMSHPLRIEFKQVIQESSKWSIK